MNIDILTLRKFKNSDNAIDIALPVFAVECEVVPPLENHLDAYEEAILRMLAIGLSSGGIAKTLNATESLVDEITERLQIKRYIEKEHNGPWKTTEDGDRYLLGEVDERASDEYQYGYMFVNAIKKDVLPYFYRGDIQQIALFRGDQLPLKLTVNGDEEATFVPFVPKRMQLREAYKNYFKNADVSQQFTNGNIEYQEAVDLFAGLETLDEEEDEDEGLFSLSDAEKAASKESNSNSFVRALKRKPKCIFLTMRLIIDPQVPGGYRVESPFDLEGLDNTYFLRQIQWLAAAEKTYLGDELFNTYLTREICKLSPSYGVAEKDYGIFVLEKIPLLHVYKDQFASVYDDMRRIYPMMQRTSNLIEKENVVGNLSKYVAESLFNAFFRGIKKRNLDLVAKAAEFDIDAYKKEIFLARMIGKTQLDLQKINWNHKYLLSAINKLATTHGNSIVEKFINLVVLNYYFATPSTQRLLCNEKIQEIYALADALNQVRRKVAHDTECKFESKDYDFYVSNVFQLINTLLEALKEN